MTKTTHARCNNRPLNRADGISYVTTFGEHITMDHNMLNLDDEPIMITGTLPSYKIATRIGCRLILGKGRCTKTASCLRRFLPPFKKTCRIFTHNSMDAWHEYSSSFRNQEYRGNTSATSYRSIRDSDGSKWSTPHEWWNCAPPDGRWQDSS